MIALHTFAAAPALPFMRNWLRWWAELRIDVELPDDALERELERLHERLRAADGRLACSLLPPLRPGFVFHYREADGEFFVYVEDAASARLAGYTVFNRLVEIDRRADRFLRAPHSRYARRYQGLGLATAVYEWALHAGLCLISGPRQSPGAHRLWRRLERRGHVLEFVQLRDQRLHLLGGRPHAGVVEDLHTRMLLLGCGWELRDLARATGAAAPPQGLGVASGGRMPGAQG